MGFRISWLASQGGKEQLLSSLGLVDTGEQDEANEAPLSVAALPGDWVVVWANDETFANDDRAVMLSRNGHPILAVYVNETCMHSTATLFTNGETTWRLHHEGDERIEFFEKVGELPAEADAIEAALRAQQAEEDAGTAEVDYLFDIPLTVAQSVCGFKHDRFSFEWGEPHFTVAEPMIVRERQSSLLARLFRI